MDVKYSYDSPKKALQNPYVKQKIQWPQQKLLTKNQKPGQNFDQVW